MWLETRSVQINGSPGWAVIGMGLGPAFQAINFLPLYISANEILLEEGQMKTIIKETPN